MGATYRAVVITQWLVRVGGLAMIGLAIQVARCTPLVTCPIGTASQGRPGQRSRQMLRETWPWRRDTPFTPAERRMAVTVM